MSETCDGCHADATHFLCDTCLDNEGVEKLRAEVERLRFELEQAQTGVLNANEQVSELRDKVKRLLRGALNYAERARKNSARQAAERQREACEEVAAVYDGTPELVAMVRATPLVTEEKP